MPEIPSQNPLRPSRIFGSTEDVKAAALLKQILDALGAVVGSVAVTSFPDNEPFNLGQVGGSSAETAGSGRLEVGSRPIAADFLDASGTTVTIKFARINADADGDNTIVTGVASKKIRVLGYALTVDAAGTLTIKDDAGSPVTLAEFEFAAAGGVSYAGGLQAPAFETTASEGLVFNNSAGMDTNGHLVYVEI